MDDLMLVSDSEDEKVAMEDDSPGLGVDLMLVSDSEEEDASKDNSSGLGLDFDDLITISDSEEEEEVMLIEE